MSATPGCNTQIIPPSIPALCGTRERKGASESMTAVGKASTSARPAAWMGYPQAQIDQMQQMGMFTGNWMAWWMVVVMVPFIGYLLFIKKYLRRDA